MMRRIIGAIAMLLGTAMLAAAGMMLINNHQAEKAAGQNAERAMYALQRQIELDAVQPAATGAPVPDMPEIEIDGQRYIGYLELPTLELKLPVLSEWSYPRLKIAPCRYWGNVYNDTMVLLAHNYQRHFGRISQLEPGAPVQFIDAEGNIFSYEVASLEVLEPTAVDEMISDSWDLTLFTCTPGGTSRQVVRLKRVNRY